MDSVAWQSKADLTLELVAVDWHRRTRNGELPTLQEYCERFPDAAEHLKESFDEVIADLSADADESEMPAQIAGYDIVREIGRGGMGIVYEAIDPELKRSIALKVLPNSALWKLNVAERFRKEAEVIARLNHQHIVPVFACGASEGTQYFALQLIPGRNLKQVLEEWNRGSTNATPSGRQFPDPHLVAKIGRQVAIALDYAHSLGIAHRDVKPANLILDNDNHVWVTDFGLAKLTGEDSALTITGDILGTLRYMSSEAINGDGGPSGDIYSLGITLYELLTLRPAFDGERSGLLSQVLHTTPTRPRLINSSIPRDLETVILKATAKSPSDRYGSVAELADDLNRFLEDRPVRARRLNRLQRFGRWARREPLAAGLTVGIFAVLMLGLMLTSWFYQDAVKANRESQLRLVELDATAGLRLIEADDPIASLQPSLVALKRLTTESLPDDSDGGLALETMLRWRMASVFDQIPAVAADLQGFRSADTALSTEWSVDPVVRFSDDGRYLFQMDAQSGEYRRWKTNFASDDATVNEFSLDNPDFYDPTASDRIAICREASLMAVEDSEDRLQLYDTQTDRLITELENPFAELGDHRLQGMWVSGNRNRIVLEVWCPELNRRIMDDPELTENRSMTGMVDFRRSYNFGLVWDLSSGKLTHEATRAVTFHADGGNFVRLNPEGSRLIDRVQAGPIHAWNLQKMDWGAVIDVRRIAERGVRNMRETGTIGYVESHNTEAPGIISVSEDGETLAVSEGGDVAIVRDTSVPLDRAYSLPRLKNVSTGDLADGDKPSRFPSYLNSGLLNSDAAVEVVYRYASSANRIIDAPRNTTIAHQGPMTTLEFNRKADRLLTAGVDRTARVWNVSDSTPVGAPMIHQTAVRVARFSPDETLVATGCNDGRVGIWDSTTGEPRCAPLPHSSAVATVAWSADGTHLAVSSVSGEIRVWNVGALLQESPIRLDGGVSVVSMSADGTHAVAGSDSGQIVAFRISDYHVTGRTSLPHSKPVQKINWIGDDDVVIVAGRRIVHFESAVYRWKIRQQESAEQISEEFVQDSQHEQMDLQTNAEHCFALLASRVLTLQTSDLAVVGTLHREVIRSSWTDAIAVSPDGEKIAMAQNQVEESLPTRNHAGRTSLPDDDDGEIHIRRAADNHKLLSLQTPTGVPLRGVAWTPDGQKLIAWGVFGIMAWDGTTGEVIRAADSTTTDAIQTARLSSDGQWLLTLRADNRCQVWSTDNFSAAGNPFQRSDIPVLLEFSADAKTLIVVTQDGVAQMIDWRRGEPVTARFRIPNRVRSAALTPDQTQVAIGGEDGSIRYWNLPEPDLRSLAEIMSNAARLMPEKND